MKRYFTPSQANKSLSFVKNVVRDILDTSAEIRVLSEECGEEFELDPRFGEYMSSMNRFYKELEKVGCFYRDWNFEMGLVDFPSYIDGREVYLCWRSDEDQLLYYHDLQSGYAGRKPIPSELLEEDILEEEVFSDA